MKDFLFLDFKIVMKLEVIWSVFSSQYRRICLCWKTEHTLLFRQKVAKNQKLKCVTKVIFQFFLSFFLLFEWSFNW